MSHTHPESRTPDSVSYFKPDVTSRFLRPTSCFWYTNWTNTEQTVCVSDASHNMTLCTAVGRFPDICHSPRVSFSAIFVYSRIFRTSCQNVYHICHVAFIYHVYELTSSSGGVGVAVFDIQMLPSKRPLCRKAWTNEKTGSFNDWLVILEPWLCI